ncbi:MAG: sterol-binding protein [Burkholderiales bacterium]|nr:sterol-binding protein [Burkholderiales bacterium]
MNSLFSLLPAAINHVLAQESWASDKLRTHVGKVARIDAGAFAMKWQVANDGMLQAASQDAVENVVIRIKPADIPLILQNRERAVSYVQVEGDADFAHIISQLAQNLKWEAEEDLSKLVGDIAAHRIVGGAKSVAATIKSTGQALAENLSEYFLEEDPMLMRAQPLSDFAREVARLRDDVERLEKRIQKIEE